MHFSTVLTYLTLTSATGWAQYVLEDDYMSGNFYDEFSFWEAADPTNGFVAYQGRSAAQQQSLISGGSGSASFGVDNTTVTPNGRPSVRLTSNKSYQSGLFVLDVEHMPGGICGTWPAFWMVGPDWPNQGEIDIIEGVNDQTSNDMTLHTGPGCSISNNKAFSGSITSSNCVSGSGDNTGCQIATQDTATYGTEFNNNKGGVYATEWDDSAISIYWFPRNSIPSDVTGGSPDPSSWGEPLAKFSGGCDISTSFTNQQIVFDTTFCGDWAGDAWSSSSCASKADTCNAFVENNPSAFDEAYWTVSGLKVYQKGAGSGGSAPSSAAPAPSYAPSTSAWNGPSTFASSTRPAAPSAPPATSAPASAAPSGIPEHSGTPALSASAAPSDVPEQSGGVPGWPASKTYGGSSPWQSGGWAEQDTGTGAVAVGKPVENNKDTDTKSHHAKHLRKHKKHRAGRL